MSLHIIEGYVNELKQINPNLKAGNFLFLPTHKQILIRAVVKTRHKESNTQPGVKVGPPQRVVSVANRQRLLERWAEKMPEWSAQVQRLDDDRTLSQYCLSLYELLTKLRPYTIRIDPNDPVIQYAVNKNMIDKTPKLDSIRKRVMEKMVKISQITAEWFETIFFYLGLRKVPPQPRSQILENQRKKSAKSSVSKFKTSSKEKWSRFKSAGSSLLGRFRRGSQPESTDSATEATETTETTEDTFSGGESPPPSPSGQEIPIVKPKVPKRPVDYDTKPLPATLSTAHGPIIVDFDGSVNMWYEDIVQNIEGYPETPVFNFLPSYREIFKTAFDFTIVTERRIVCHSNWTKTSARWRPTYPDWAKQVDQLSNKKAVKAYIRQLVSLMTDLKRDIYLIREDPIGHWKLSRMTIRPEKFGRLSREPLLAVDILISDFNLIGIIAMNWYDNQ